MKLSFVLLLATFLQVSAATYAQKLNLSLNNVSLEDAFKQVRKQSGYNILYNAEMLTNTRTVDLQIKNATITNVMDRVLQQQGLSYHIIDNNIIISKQPVPEKKESIPAIAITGKITDEKGEPLPGVTIKAKGLQTAAVSDKDGIYKITLSVSSATLVFTSIGYLSQEITVTKGSILNVVLKEQNTGLNEVVVIGYGTSKKKDLTGAVGSVNIGELQKAPVRSFDEALAGRIAGVQVSTQDGQPGNTINIVVRGGNSLTQDNSPLYVIDGFPIEGPNNNFINPQDIESIEVLKDASATAIYGARGANGVIIITTKKGKSGDPVINYDAYYGIQKNLKTIPVLSPYEFVKFYLERDAVTATSLYLQNGNTLESYRNVPGIDWQSQILRTAPMQNHSLSVSGGNGKTTYSISGNILNQEGIIVGSGYKRYQGRMALDQTISDKLKVGLISSYANTFQNGTPPSQTNLYGTANLLSQAWGFRPLNSPNGNDDLLNQIADAAEPVNVYLVNPLLTAKNEIRNVINNGLNANGYAEYSFTKNLKLRVTGGIYNNTQRNESFNGSNTNSGRANSPLGLGVNGSVIYFHTNSLLNENTLSYNNTFKGNHTISAVVGFTDQTGKTFSNGVSAIQLPNESLGLSGLDEGTAQTVTATSSNWTLASFLGRVNYSYKSRYLFTGTFRADGSSRFSDQNKWSYFPSGAVAWRLTEEPFMKQVTSISNAKFRLSYGVTGNNRVGDFSYLSTIGFPVNGGYSFGGGIGGINGAAYPTVLGNKDLKWETTGQWDAGLDVGLLKDRISLVIDLYRKTTTNLLLNANLPLSSGFDNAFENIGSVRNDGLEFSLTTANISGKDFSWSSSFNISFNKSKVLQLAQNQESLLSTVSWESNYSNLPAYIAKVGQPYSQIYGYVFQGLYQYADFDKLANGTYLLKPNIPTNGNTRANIQPGDIKYKDVNGDGVVDTRDQAVIGRGTPIHVGGFNNNFTYRNFDLSVFFQWSYGNDIVNANRLVFESGYQYSGYQNMYATYANRWSPTNTNTDIPRTFGNLPLAYSSRVVEDGSYLRLKTVSFGYNFPQKYLKKVHMRTLHLYVSAQNLYTWTNYSGLDPEVSVRNTNLTQGFDFSAYPHARTLTFGINTSF